MSAESVNAYLNVKRMVANAVMVGHINIAIGMMNEHNLLNSGAEQFLADIKPMLPETVFTEFESQVKIIVS